ncbi:TlpA disulfide reductase family protein [Tamlana sp. 2_MG-2023]|uniref:TlpA family protein disulfide reductase n=1 Tax=unclassified Tamlana TaxID=2614803 RepID=UPI0026E2E989|nr:MULTISPECIES: TlpA disulfide reductase family protein [unclassified Tamlana]MDO6761871.1 TlpA disulfide reductase family protein [Tamlana sp. 2_MG-2023]MDO6792207.1 TlpA disulfide reductase family protein [Tamlana sp. 1_MG-2023]
MKKGLLCLTCLITLNSICQETNKAILEKTISELNKIEKVRYLSKSQGTESGKIYLDQTKTFFFDFKKSPSTIPRFLINDDSEHGVFIYNGKRSIHTALVNNEKIAVVNDSPDINNPLLLTLYPLKKILPEILVEENIIITRKKDTIINNEANYVIDLSYKNGFLDWDKLVLKNGMSFDSRYLLIINKKDFLPRMMTMNNGPTGTLSNTFENFDFDYMPDSKVWDGSLIPTDYQIMNTKEFRALLQKQYSLNGKPKSSFIGKSIVECKIPDLNNNSLVDFSTFKGNVVLLEFWFKYCGPCVKAIPKLNELNKKLKNDNFLLYGVEFNEDFPRENLQEYVSKIGIDYPVLYKGKKLASNYSVQSAPTFMIINKKGNIIYLESGFDQEKIEEIIKDNL